MDPREEFNKLVEIMARLRSPDGCPWDREQTPQSIKHNLLEEACEVLDALDGDDKAALREELGDLLLQVVFQARMAEEAGDFDIAGVIAGINEKLKRRHPHIFGDQKIDTAGEVLRSWDMIKAGEKEGYSHLGGIPRSLPALALAQKLQERAARTGFDWPDDEGVLEKLEEEIAELFAAETSSAEAMAEEFGDVLFTLVNAARHLGLDSETALRKTADKFRRRFLLMEKFAKERGIEFASLSLDAQDKLWDEAKSAEKS